jgi:LPXTG-motif cell wall-anchored protein
MLLQRLIKYLTILLRSSADRELLLRSSVTTADHMIRINGGATTTRPVSGFDDPGLEELFRPKNESTDNTSRPSESHGQPSVSSTATSTLISSGATARPPKENVPAIGVITGSVIGGILGLAALLSLILLFFRRKRQRGIYEITELGDTSATNLDSRTVFEKPASHVHPSELPATRDSKSEFGSELPAEMYGDHVAEMGV